MSGDLRVDSAAPPEANPDLRRPGRGRGGERPPSAWRFVVDAVKMAWRWLTRMRTALYLLGALGLMSLLATAVPQQPNVPGTVEAWRTGTEGPGTVVSSLIDAVGGYDVYGSPAFLALLLLLYLSLTACLVPRIRAWVRLVRTSQPPLTRHAGRQEHATSLTTVATPQQVHTAAREVLARRHWRVRPPGLVGPGGRSKGVHDASDAGRGGPPPQVAAEKGLWSREGGSLLFHVSFYVLLAAIVFGQLSGFTGQRAVVEGEAFADTPVSYWTRDPGRWWGDGDHAGWVLDLDHFAIDWVRDPTAPGAGQPTLFRSDVTIERDDGSVVDTHVEGNEPITVDGMKIHQLDWGYAPLVEVEVDGEVVSRDYVTASVSDTGDFRGVVKAPGVERDLGLELFLFPYAPERDGVPVPTGAPWDEAPLLLARRWDGDLQLGRTQQTINELDTSQMESNGGGFVRPGSELDLGDGVVVRFPELRRWVGFQVSSRPQIPYLLFGAGLLLAGLVPALYAYRRRLWVVAARDPEDGSTLVTVAGRAFQRPQAFEDEHAKVVAELASAVDGRPGVSGAGPGPAPGQPEGSTDPAVAGVSTDAGPRR